MTSGYIVQYAQYQSLLHVHGLYSTLFISLGLSFSIFLLACCSACFTSTKWLKTTIFIRRINMMYYAISTLSVFFILCIVIFQYITNQGGKDESLVIVICYALLSFLAKIINFYVERRCFYKHFSKQRIGYFLSLLSIIVWYILDVVAFATIDFYSQFDFFKLSLSDFFSKGRSFIAYDLFDDLILQIRIIFIFSFSIAIMTFISFAIAMHLLFTKNHIDIAARIIYLSIISTISLIVGFFYIYFNPIDFDHYKEKLHNDILTEFLDPQRIIYSPYFYQKGFLLLRVDAMNSDIQSSKYATNLTKKKDVENAKELFHSIKNIKLEILSTSAYDSDKLDRLNYELSNKIEQNFNTILCYTLSLRAESREQSINNSNNVHNFYNAIVEIKYPRAMNYIEMLYKAAIATLLVISCISYRYIVTIAIYHKSLIRKIFQFSIIAANIMTCGMQLVILIGSKSYYLVYKSYYSMTHYAFGYKSNWHITMIFTSFCIFISLYILQFIIIRRFMHIPIDLSANRIK